VHWKRLAGATVAYTLGWVVPVLALDLGEPDSVFVVAFGSGSLALLVLTAFSYWRTARQ